MGVEMNVMTAEWGWEPTLPLPREWYRVGTAMAPVLRGTSNRQFLEWGTTLRELAILEHPATLAMEAQAGNGPSGRARGSLLEVFCTYYCADHNYSYPLLYKR